MQLKVIVSIYILCFSLFAESKTLVISDIDDTIKVSHILSRRGASSSFLDEYSRFVGMAELFQALKQNSQDIEFHYVSLAPELLMYDTHLEFLEDANFPITGLHTNPGLSQDPNQKQKVIRELIRARKPDLILYFGDNGQFDTLVYLQMAQEFSEIPQYTYIREAYSSKYQSKYPTYSNQIGFVTSAELAFDLLQKDLITQRSYSLIEKRVYSYLIDEDFEGETIGRMVFAWWQDCRDFKWQWGDQIPELLGKIKSRISKRCSIN